LITISLSLVLYRHTSSVLFINSRSFFFVLLRGDESAKLTMTPISLLTAVDSTSHVHLIVGSNPLAGARCSKSLEVGAKPLLIAPETAELHYTLQKRIDNGEVKWLKKSFEDEDVMRLGREEIGGVVDAVFVTSGSRDPMSMDILPFLHSLTNQTRCAYLATLQTESHTGKCGRLSKSLHILLTLDTHGRSFTNWCDNQWQRM
jgi:hypothetical protein